MDRRLRFGGSYSPPMPLADGAEATAPDDTRFRLSHDTEGWTLWRDGDAATSVGATPGRAGGGIWLHSRHRTDADETAATIEDSHIYRMRLSMAFGIDLSAAEVPALKLF